MKKYLRAKYCAEYLNVAETTFWHWVTDGRIKKGIRLSPRVTVWHIDDLEDFVKQRQRADTHADRAEIA